MADIYDQHAAAFTNVSAYVILKDGERVATVAIKFPRDGAGRLWAYCHWMGAQMERAYSSGYGYDKRTPAVLGAFLKADYRNRGEVAPEEAQRLVDFKAALRPHAGDDWTRQIEKVGYTVLQAV